MTPAPNDIENLIADLNSLPGWEERYEYIIELGRELPPYPAAAQTEAHLVRGCTSIVYASIGWRADGTLALALTSDALIVNGLLALVYAAYNGKTAQEARGVNLPKMLQSSALLAHLSPNRRHGFASVVARVESFVKL